MRSKIVFGLLLSFFAGIGAIEAVRLAPPSTEASADTSTTAPDGGVADAGATDGGKGDGGPAVDQGILGRPLRVAGLGWELLAPGLIANNGITPGKASEFAAARLPVSLKAVDSMDKLEGALARGGTDPDGADVALVPLPLFVSAYERLRALEPSIFYVVGWSRGREAVLSTTDTLPVFPATGDVPVIAAGGDLPMFLALFTLDAAGVEASRVRLLSPKTAKAEEVSIAVMDRLTPEEIVDKARRKILFTTADAPRLIPFVAVAQQSMIDHHADVLALWARIWIDGQLMLRADVTSAARQIATAKGSPEPLGLLTRLGQIEPVSLPENARLCGLSGRSALTLDALFHRTWALWRSSGALASPPPAAAPVSPSVVAAMIRGADASLLTTVAPFEPDPALNAPGVTKKADASPETVAPLLVHTEPEAPDAQEKLVRSIGLLAGIFDRSPLRVTVARAEDTEATIAAAVERYGLRAARIVAGKAVLADKAGVVEVLPAR